MNLGEFYTQNTHVNEVTGCIIWDGIFQKGHPVVEGAVKINVRKFVYESVNGQQPYRTKFGPACENPWCVKLEHITAIPPEVKAPDYPMERVAEAYRLYHEEGMRQEVVAQKLGVDPPTISKYIRVAKANLKPQEAASED